jgi:type IV secretion system protein VirB10
VTPNNPYHPDDENQADHVSPHEGADERPDPLANNPYSQQRQQAPQPDLDSAAPTLAANDVRRMNRRALGFLAAIVALLLFAGYFILSGGGSKQQVAEKPREERVNVPQAPQVMPTPALPRVEQAEPIALAPPPPLPTPEQMRARASDGPRGPTLLERRIMAANEGAQAAGNAGGAGGQYPNGPGGFMGGAMPGFPGPAAPNTGIPPNSAYGAKEPADVSSADPLSHPDTLMLRGTFIRCVLETRIITDIPGFTSCVVTEPVYSFTGKRLLLPKGSKVLGKYEMEPNGPRVAVIWDRVVTPTGIDVKMASPGVDNLGGAGHPGYYNAHWGSRIGAALLISLLSDAFKYEAAEHGPRTTNISDGGVVTQTPFESNTAQTLQQLANSAVQRQASRPATVTINQGTVLAIYVAKDVDFSGVVARY